MDDDVKHLRVSFSGVRQQDHGGGGETVPAPSHSQPWTGSRRGLLSNAEEHDAAYAATVAAVAYAIAAREEERLLPASQQRPAAADMFPAREEERLLPPSQQRPVVKKPAAASMDEPRARLPQSKSPPPPKRGDESLKRPMEGSRSSRWFSGKEPIDDDDYQDEQANVSVNRPIRPAQKKQPEGAFSDERVGLPDSAPPPSIKKDPSFTRKASEKRGSRRFEQDHQGNQTVPPLPATARPTGKTSSSYSGPTGTTSGMAFSGEAQAMADAWEKEKLARIKKQYNETMETIAEWEAEKKAKARRQKELKEESESERKRAKALEEYNEEMARINKVAAASRLTAEDKRRSAESKVRDKAQTIRSTGKLPRTCACF